VIFLRKVILTAFLILKCPLAAPKVEFLRLFARNDLAALSITATIGSLKTLAAFGDQVADGVDVLLLNFFPDVDEDRRRGADVILVPKACFSGITIITGRANPFQLIIDRDNSPEARGYSWCVGRNPISRNSLVKDFRSPRPPPLESLAGIFILIC